MITGRDVLLYEKKGHIVTMTINREERRNAISNELSERIDESYQEFNEDDDAWVAIFTGRGDVAFCSGHDMKEDVEGDVRGIDMKTYKRPVFRRAHPDVHTWKSVIAAINGYCLAGGWYLAQMCDVRIAAEHAQFGIPEVRWNLPAGFGARFEYVASIGIACEMLLWGRSISAQRAYEIGFVNKVVPKEKLKEECMEWAEYMCTLGQDSVRAHKEMIYRGRDMSVHELQLLGSREGGVFQYLKHRADATEGQRAFMERRQPQYGKPTR